jgi:hypothetical protein
MIHRHLPVAAILFAAVFPIVAADAPSTEQLRAALRKATDYLTSISTEGGYLWRYSEDLRERRGEEKATATQICSRPARQASAWPFSKLTPPRRSVTSLPRRLQRLRWSAAS